MLVCGLFSRHGIYGIVFREGVEKGFFSELSEDGIRGLTPDQRAAYERISLKETRSGMVLASPVVTNKGRLLVIKGMVMTEVLIDKVLKFHQLDTVVEHIYVVPKNHRHGGAVIGSAVGQ